MCSTVNSESAPLYKGFVAGLVITSVRPLIGVYPVVTL